MVKLRQCSLEDLDRVTEIRRTSLPDPWPKALFLKTHRQYPDSFIVAEENKEVIGYAVGKIQNSSGRIISLAVDPKWRGKRTGTALAKSLIKQFEEKGVKEIFLSVRTWNKNALAFYKNLGFEIVKTIKKYYPNSDDAYFMKKDLGN